MRFIDKIFKGREYFIGRDSVVFCFFEVRDEGDSLVYRKMIRVLKRDRE